MHQRCNVKIIITPFRAALWPSVRCRRIPSRTTKRGSWKGGRGEDQHRAHVHRPSCYISVVHPRVKARTRGAGLESKKKNQKVIALQKRSEPNQWEYEKGGCVDRTLLDISRWAGSKSAKGRGWRGGTSESCKQRELGRRKGVTVERKNHFDRQRLEVRRRSRGTNRKKRCTKGGGRERHGQSLKGRIYVRWRGDFTSRLLAVSKRWNGSDGNGQ